MACKKKRMKTLEERKQETVDQYLKEAKPSYPSYIKSIKVASTNAKNGIEQLFHLAGKTALNSPVAFKLIQKMERSYFDAVKRLVDVDTANQSRSVDENINEATKRLSKDLKAKLETAIDKLIIGRYDSAWTGNEAEIIIQYMNDKSPEFPKMTPEEMRIASAWIHKVY